MHLPPELQPPSALGVALMNAHTSTRLAMLEIEDARFHGFPTDDLESELASKRKKDSALLAHLMATL